MCLSYFAVHLAFYKLNSVSCTRLYSTPPLCSRWINTCCYTANLWRQILKSSFLWSNVFIMMQHGNFCATSEIWTDFIRGIARRWRKNVIISTNFWVSLWWCEELLVGTEKWGWRALKKNLICTFQPHRNGCNKRLKPGWRLMHEATPIKYIQYSNTLSKKIILSSLLESFMHYSVTWLIPKEHLHKTEPMH